MENIALNENMSLAEFLREQEELKKQAEQIDRENATEQEKEALAKYEANNEVLGRARVALDYTRNSTAVVAVDDPTKYNDAVVTIFPSLEVYCENAVVLTGGFDKGLQDVLESTRTGEKLDPFLEDFVNAPLYDKTVKKEIDNQIKSYAPETNRSFIEQVSVGDFIAVVENVEKEMKEHHISRSNVIEGTRAELNSANYLGVSNKIAENFREREGVLDKETEGKAEVFVYNDGEVKVDGGNEIENGKVAQEVTRDGDGKNINHTILEDYTEDPAEARGNTVLKESGNTAPTKEEQNGEIDREPEEKKHSNSKNDRDLDL